LFCGEPLSGSDIVFHHWEEKGRGKKEGGKEREKETGAKAGMLGEEVQANSH